jgi:uncharacterized protein YbjT (DUF2867 family)
MILIVGGTGTLGRDLVPRLLARGRSVRTLARHPATPANGGRPGEVEARIGDVRDAATCASALEGVDTVVSAMTGFAGRDALGSRTIDRDANLLLIEAARRAGVRHVILLSVHQAGPDHPIQLFRDKWAAEEALRGSGLDWTIVRPTAYLETWLGIVGGPLVQTGSTRIFGSGRNPINFVSASDVGQVVELAIADPGLRGATIEVPGPQDLTLDQLADTVESVLGRRGRRQHLSPTMMRIASLVTRVVNPVLSAQIATAMVMDTRDMTVDGQALRARFGSIPMTTAADVAQRMFASTVSAEATAT